MHPGARRRPSPRRLLVGIWEKVQQPTSRWVQCSNTNNSMMTTKPSRHQWRHNRTLKRLEVLNPQKNYTEEYHSSGWKRKTAVAPCLPSRLDVDRGRERKKRPRCYLLPVMYRCQRRRCYPNSLPRSRGGQIGARCHHAMASSRNLARCLSPPRVLLMPLANMAIRHPPLPNSHRRGGGRRHHPGQP
jgi:hypothetical protein